MRNVLLRLGVAGFALALTHATAATAQPQVDAVEQSLSAGEVAVAADLISRLALERRPADGSLRRDALLSGFSGRLYLAVGRAATALPYLEFGATADVPASQRVETLFALIDAHVMLGEHERGTAVLARLEAERLDAVQRRQLDIAAAELLLITDPRAALDRLQPLLAESDPLARFEAELLASRALLILGEREAAALAAGRAWAGAAGQPVQRLAPLRAALVQAALAALRDERGRLLEMLALANVTATTPERELAHYLPICGEDGITADDYVTLAAYSGPALGHRLMAVAASRPEAVAPFLSRLGGRAGFSPQGNWPMGTLITVACRSIPSAVHDVDARSDPQSRLFAEHGLYMPLPLEWDSERVRDLERAAAEIEASHGPDHPHLAPVLIELANRISTEAPDNFAAIHDFQLRAAAAARRLPDAERLFPTEEELTFERTGFTSREQALETIGRLRLIWRSRVEQNEIDLAYSLATIWLRIDRDLPKTEERDIVELLARRFDSRPRDPRRRALLMRLGRLETELGDSAAAQDAYRAAGVPDNGCPLVHRHIGLVSGEIGHDAYPASARQFEVPGRTLIEYGLDAGGGVTGQRAILSVPSTLFDEAAMQGFGGYRYAVEPREGRSRPCIGLVVNLLWRMEEEGDRPFRFDPFTLDPV